MTKNSLLQRLTRKSEDIGPSRIPDVDTSYIEELEEDSQELDRIKRKNFRFFLVIYVVTMVIDFCLFPRMEGLAALGMVVLQLVLLLILAEEYGIDAPNAVRDKIASIFKGQNSKLGE